MDLEYEHECSRAELLGLQKPTREEFERSRAKCSGTTDEEKTEYEDEAGEIAKAKEERENEKREGFRRMTGGLDELNSILANTQKKLNRIKNVFGNFTSLVRNQTIIQKEDGKESDKELPNQKFDEDNGDKADEETKSKFSSPSYSKKTDDSDIGKLDLLISKAEKAEVSLSSQNKQMKKFLN